jgi:hypothetical protein
MNRDDINADVGFKVLAKNIAQHRERKAYFLLSDIFCMLLFSLDTTHPSLTSLESVF